VTCLTVNGNDAVVSGVQMSSGAGHGQILVAEIVNGGSPSSDQLRFSANPFISPGPLQGCSTANLGPIGNVSAAGIQIGS
jgi:hypothetical protein